MTLKIVAISDTHGQRVKNLPKGDLLIHSGDWSTHGSYLDTDIFVSYLRHIRTNYKKVIVVPGNHDKWVEANQDQARKEFAAVGVELLIDESTFFDGQHIYGMPWTCEFGRWSFMGNDVERADKCDLIPDDTTILVTHGPPQGHLDALAANGSDPGAHVGCQRLRRAIDRVSPAVHIFGHIHEGAGVEVLAKTLLVNASCMDEYYRLVNGFKVIYL